MAKTVDQLIADIDAQLETLIASPPVDYTEGDISVKNSQKITLLQKLRESLLTSGPSADIAIMEFNSVISEFGIDTTEYTFSC